MSLGSAGAQSWIDRGKQAYWQMHLSEAETAFERAVEIEPESVEARLCLGVASLFLYQNGLSDAQALVAEQNSTNGKRAEENLQQALLLDPRNELAMAYLAALYRAWLDPAVDRVGNHRRPRLAEALQLYKRVLEIHPAHKVAHYACGALDWELAFQLVRSSGSYPRPLPNEEARQSLQAKIAPLIDDGTRHLLRTLEIDPANSKAKIYLDLLERAQEYSAGTNTESQQAGREARPAPQGSSMTFYAVERKGSNTVRPFPPDPWHWLPLAPPPPPLPAFKQ